MNVWEICKKHKLRLCILQKNNGFDKFKVCLHQIIHTETEAFYNKVEIVQKEKKM